MAVSMNSGFMRSDYMISDAALPLRMDELEMEQLDHEATFSDILGGIGEATATEAPAVPQEESIAATEQTTVLTEVKVENPAEAAPLSKAELKALAGAIAQGRIKLDEIPEQYVSDVLMMAVAMMMLGVPEDEIPLPEEYSEEAVKPIRLDVETAVKFLEKAEQKSTVDELLQVMSEATGIEIPKDMKLTNAQIETVELAAEIASAEANAATTEPITQSAKAEIAAAQAAEQVAQPQQTIAQNLSEQEMQVKAELNSNSTAQTASAEQVKLTEEFEQLRRMVSEYTVKKSEAEQPAQQSYTAQSLGTDNAAKSRVVSKSDELELLKGTASKPEEIQLNAAVEIGTQQKSENATQQNSENGTQTQANANGNAQQLPMEQAAPQSMMAEAPVVFVRSDGTEVEVKPAEVVRQITTTVVEQSSTVEGDTEYSITLNPEDLGSITVKLTKTVDGAMTVSITADNARTQRLIEQNGAAIQENLRHNGIELENWQTVNQSEQQTRAQDYSGSGRNPQYDGEQNQPEDEDSGDNSFAELITAM